MALKHYPLWVGGKPRYTEERLTVQDKYSGECFAEVSLATRETILEAIEKASAASSSLIDMASFERKAVLDHCVKRFKEQNQELSECLCREAGKPIRDSRGEVTRLIDTFQIAAEESTRLGGEVLPLDIVSRAKGYWGQWKRFPIGPCSFISPFNFPLNLAAHKIAPAIAVGCPFILKPASLTPLSALAIGEVLAETNLPPGAFSILPCKRHEAALFVSDSRLKCLSFTGSPSVGWDLKTRSAKMKVILELGGNAAVIVDEDADIEDTVSRVVMGAFYQSGQSCISVQRIVVHESLYLRFRDRLVEVTRKLKVGDPKEEDTVIGPVISEEDAIRLETWIRKATRQGARILCGGQRNGSMLEATLLENVPADATISCEEAFGPVAVLSSFSNFEDALREVNRSRFGLQAGVFTRDLHKAHLAWERLEVGGVIINDVPSWRVDHMPYGGIKDSGLGREGVRSAMEEMSEIRMLIVRGK